LRQLYKEGLGSNRELHIDLNDSIHSFYTNIYYLLRDGSEQTQRNAKRSQAYSNLRNDILSLMTIAERGRISQLVGKSKKVRRVLDAYLKEFADSPNWRSEFLEDYDNQFTPPVLRELARRPDRKDIRKAIVQGLKYLVRDLNPKI
jgi:hypothetical protein